MTHNKPPQSDIGLDLESFFAQFPLRHYHRGQILIYANEQPSYAYYLESGKVRQYMITDTGSELVLDVYRPRTAFPFTYVLTQSANDYFFEGTEDITVRIAPINALATYLQDNPDKTFQLLRSTGRLIEESFRRMCYMMGASAYARLLYELVEQCRGNKNSTGSLNIEIHEYELASRVGLSRETTNRELKKLKNKGLLSTGRNHIRIHNIFHLQKELQNSF